MNLKSLFEVPEEKKKNTFGLWSLMQNMVILSISAIMSKYIHAF